MVEEVPASSAGPHWLIAGAVAAFCALVGLAFPFVSIFQHNRHHFQLSFSEHLTSVVFISLLIFFVLVAVQAAFKGRTGRFATLVLFVLGTIAWINTVVLVGNFGFFDGGEIEWISHWPHFALELLLTAIVIAAVAWKPGWIYNNLLFLTALLTGLALVPPILADVDATGTSGSEYVFTQDGVVQLSADTNVLLIVVDTMQSDVFAEIVREDESWVDVFSGFTYFPNSLSAFPKTYASVPALLTGDIFGNEQTVQDYLRSAYFSGSLPQLLVSNGFDVRMLAYRIQPLLADPRLAQNVVGANSRNTQIEPTASAEFYQVLDLVAFRLAPVPLKPWIYNGGQFRLVSLSTTNGENDTGCETQPRFSAGNDHHDLAFLDRFTSCSSLAYEQPAFRFYHLSGAHEPFVLDGELQHHEPAPRTRQSFRRHSEGAIAVVREMFERLKALGAYEDALIVVVGDHGGGELDVGVDPSVRPDLQVEGSYQTQLTPRTDTVDLIAGAIPLILVKRPGATGPMETSEAPVQLTDVPATVLSELGLPVPSGRSMFQIDENERRVRLHRYYKFAGWSVDYILPMTEFRVDGHSWDPASWSTTSTNLNPRPEQTNGGNYATLFEGGNPYAFLVQGWEKPTLSGVRMSDTSATLRFPGGFAEEGPPLRLTVVHQPLRSKTVDEVALDVYVDDRLTDSWTILPGARRISGLLPREALGHGAVEVSFRAESVEAVSALVFHEVAIEPLRGPGYTLGTNLDFKKGGNAEIYQVDGFSHQENWGTWSLGNRAVMLFQLDPTLSDLEVSITAAAAVTPEMPSHRVHAFVNGTHVADLRLTRREPQTVSFDIPAAVADDPYLELELRLPDAVSPYELGQSKDNRRLAMGFVSMRIEAADAEQERQSATFSSGRLKSSPRPRGGGGAIRMTPH